MSHQHEDTEATAFWEELYQQRDRIWSGKANKALVDVVTEMTAANVMTADRPGRALDLGSGEGGDAIWLAEQGWQVTGLDISATALERAVGHAAERGVPPERIRWQQADLTSWAPGTEEEYELVSACFLHSPVAFPREQVLRRAADAVAPGGLLLVVGHAAFPPWSHMTHEERPPLPSAHEVLDSLALPDGEWQTVLAENRSRAVKGPDSEDATIDDAVLLVRRRGA